MDKDAYIRHLEARIVELEKRIEELERLLGMNSKNSSKPPSSDPPTSPTALPQRRRKKRRAKKGHQPFLRELLPPEKVTKRIELEPQVCPCGRAFEKTDEPPLRHQIVDIPPIEPEVIEYVQHVRRCEDCGELLYQHLPDEVKRRYFGLGAEPGRCAADGSRCGAD